MTKQSRQRCQPNDFNSLDATLGKRVTAQKKLNNQQGSSDIKNIHLAKQRRNKSILC